jgi:thioredoxin 1
MAIQNVEENAELSQIISKSADKVVVVDFFATWCGPCMRIAPKLEEMSKSEQYKDKVVFLKVDVDGASEISEKYKIQAMPTFLLFKNGERVDEMMGANEVKLKAIINKSLGN